MAIDKALLRETCFKVVPGGPGPDIPVEDASAVDDVLWEEEILGLSTREFLARSPIQKVLQTMCLICFYIGRRYEVAAALAEVAVDSGEKAT